MGISLASLGRRGIFVSFGNASGTVPAFEPLKLIGKSLFLTRPKLLDYVQDRDALVARSSEVFGWIREGKLKVSVDRAFPWTRTPRATSTSRAAPARGRCSTRSIDQKVPGGKGARPGSHVRPILRLLKPPPEGHSFL